MKRNPESTNIAGERFWPLNEEQRREFHMSAKKANNPLEELTGLTLLHGGMRNTTFHHLRNNWLEIDDDGDLRIAVPPTEICTGGAGKTGANNEAGKNLHRRGKPCHPCRSCTPGWVGRAKRKEDYHDNKWHPKTKARAQNPIPIEQLNKYTARKIEWWFEQNEEIPMLHSAVNNKVEKIKERAGIEREVTAHDLRNTFGTHLARKKVERRRTANLLGHTSTEPTEKFYTFIGAGLKAELQEKLDDNLDGAGV